MLADLLISRRSIRSFKPIPVDEASVKTLLAAGLASASSRAIRPWELIVVDDPELLASLSRAKKHGSGFLIGAPLAFVVLGIPSESDVWIEDVSIVSSNILLAAQDLGLGACWIQIRLRDAHDGSPSESYVRRILSIPVSRSVESIIAVGYPDESPKGYRTEDLRWDKVHRNRC